MTETIVSPSRRGHAASQPDWTPPEIPESDLKWAVASSVLEEFAQGHNFSDILRELVQNEYDAEGSSLAVAFAADGLHIHGNGKVIDRAGWRRLSVMLGTGRVVGDGRQVPQKFNSIGSKNHGLRALFLIGDRIYVRSGGQQTVLNARLGTPPEPRPDPTSSHLRGVHIFVPYRRTADGLLAPYTDERAANDMNGLRAKVAPALLKLAEPGARRSVHLLTVTSDRTETTLDWRQKTKLVRSLPRGGKLVERSIELRESIAGWDGSTSDKITELEYQRPVTIPKQFRTRNFPSYFKVSGARLRIGVSLRLKRRRPDVKDIGSFYYPLGMSNGATGSALSVSAPFEMNADRSALVEVSDWNAWLAEEAAEFVIDLLPGEWMSSFGPAAFTLLRNHSVSPFPLFADKLEESLREAECWPCRESKPRSRQPRLRRATDLVVSSWSELDVLIGKDRLLAEAVATPEVEAMAMEAGAKEFTLSSAVRLRCVGNDGSSLKTALSSHEANLHYTDFPNALIDADLQRRFGEAFDAQKRHLSPSHRQDLKFTATTLTEAGTLAAPAAPLWVLDEDLYGTAPVAQDERLHRSLASCAVISRLCEPFDTTRWALEVADRADDGVAAERDLESLFRYLLKRPKAVKAKAWSSLRGAPIWRDHRGEWAPADQMVDYRTPKAGRLEPILRFPGKEIRRSRELLRLLRLRSKLSGRDVVSYAEYACDHPDDVGDIEETLHELRALLTPSTLGALRSLPFLPTSERLEAPEACYVRSPFLESCIGLSACFAVGHRPSLEVRLGCRTKALAADVVHHLEDLRETGGRPDGPIVYPELLQAVRREGSPLRFADARIIHIKGDWFSPEDILVGRRHLNIFSAAVPVLTQGDLATVCSALGAPSEPTLGHWQAFFAWLERQTADGGRLDARSLRSLRDAYAVLGSLPTDIPDHVGAFVDDQGRLHSRSDARAERFLVNDEPPTADAIQRAGLDVSFTSTPDAASRRFCQESGVRPLSAVRRLSGTSIGSPKRSQGWLDEERVLSKLHDPALASAVYAVAAWNGSQTATAKETLLEQLAQVRRVTFVADIEDVYLVGRSRIVVPVAWALSEDQLALCSIKSKNELWGLVALAIASMAEAQHDLRQPLADAVFRLLFADDPSDMQHYLAQRGVPWTASHAPSGEDAEWLADRTEVVETLTEQLISRASTRPRPTDAPSAEEPPPPTKRSPTPRPPLPPLDQVALSEAPALDWSPGEPERQGVRRRSVQWTPRGPKEQEEDRQLGERGEELVYRAERERIAALGFPEDRVKWTSRSDPGADHDILSVADDGGDLWLEVKATTGRHGRFEWSRSEFELALAARERYILCRVYEADSIAPQVRHQPDPIAQLLAGEMRLDISDLSAEIAPLSG